MRFILLRGFISALMLIVLCESGTAQEADTTWVQTFTWEAQNNPATNYESPGRRWFEFPSADLDTSYSKILMYYNLKCFEDGTAGGLGYDCGEWDYLSYTYLFDHTGLLDSNVLTHPHYLINDADFELDTLIFESIVGTVSDTIRTEHALPSWNGASASVWVEQAGNSWSPALPFGTDSMEQTSRMQWLWLADELTAIGLEAGPIDGWECPAFAPLVEQRDAVQWAARWTDQDSLFGFTEGEPSGIATVSDLNHPGRFILSAPLAWDGISNLIVEAQLHGANWGGAFPEIVDGNTAVMRTWNAVSAGQFARFDGNDRLEVDVAELSTIEEQITVEFWQRGDPTFQPENNSICEGANANNQREVNIHLPWSNSRVYWDAGFDGGYDRIDQAAAMDQYEGQWNHWAFTKDAGIGNMSVYLNGELWHAGNDKDNAFGQMVRFNLGCNANGGNDYRGDVDGFRMWSSALDEVTIATWMDSDDVSEHPNAADLVAQFDMEMSGGWQVDGAGASGYFHGNAGRYAYDATSCFYQSGPMPSDFRPSLTWFQGGQVEDSDAVIIDHAVPVPPVSISEWSVAGNGVIWTDLAYAWPYDRKIQTRMQNGDLLAEYPIQGSQEIIVNDQLNYYSPAFDVIDRYELARFITPYGIGLSLGDDGWTWVFDVTDFAPFLRDSVELEAGNWQELLDMKFAFIHGTPARDVKRVEAFWKGQFGLAGFDENVTDHAFTPELGESMFKLKTRASGHGFGSGNNCGEFCFNTHAVKVNGVQQWSWEIMRECGDNPLYPQGGTWIYDRAAWCPGAPVDTKEFELSPLVNPEQPFTVDYDITYDPDGNYRFEGQIIAYGAANMQHDVEIVEVLAPSDVKVLSRWNPICESPRVMIRNNGAQLLTKCIFNYGVVGGETQFHTWEGELAFLESTEVALPYDDPLLREGDDEVWLKFEVEVQLDEGVVDEEPRNNITSASFHRVPTWSYSDLDDNRIIVWTKTNEVPWETSIEITDADGNVVWGRGYAEVNTTFRDTLALNQGCYRITIYDSDDDGQGFWANNDGSGYTRIKRVAGGNFINFEPDFGKSISQAFFFETNVVTSVHEAFVIEAEAAAAMVAFPNPTTESIQVRLSGFAQGALLRWYLRDALGRLVDEGSWVPHGGYLLQIPCGRYGLGTYSLTVQSAAGKRCTGWVQVR